jgi:RNA polymerase subunit RPABC4/transcription elongation factor Spt4
MKKSLLTLIAPLVLFSTLSAQITQQQADFIVQQRMSDETKPFTVYAKENVQPTGYTISTATGEILELDYPAWIYYVSFTGKVASPHLVTEPAEVRNDAFGKYLIVKESSGNLLDVNVKNDTGPVDLEEWREVNGFPIEIPIEDYPITETLCLWTNVGLIYTGKPVIINSNEELEQIITCAEGNYPEIDFSKHSLLIFFGYSDFVHEVFSVDKSLHQVSENKYRLDIELFTLQIGVGYNLWNYALITNKLEANSIIEVNKTTSPSCAMKNLSFSWEGELIIINSNEEMNNYMDFTENYDPDIDFSKHTLLMASGLSSEVGAVGNNKLTKIGSDNYNLELHLSGVSTIPGRWIHYVLISKLSPETVILLTVIDN